jgi:hypothetical protein
MGSTVMGFVGVITADAMLEVRARTASEVSVVRIV